MTKRGENIVRYKRLDYLRIISCILVLLYHLNILKGGFLAVCTFFTLSGYLGCISALKNNNFSIKKYYISRVKKIYLPLIIVVFCTIIIYKLNPISNWINLKPETNSIILGYNNFWQLNANLDYFTRNVNSPFIHFWYISILMQFELIFPILFVFFQNLNKKLKKDVSTIVMLVLTIIATAVFYYMSLTQNIMIVYYNTFARSFSIIFGILLALLQYKYNFKILRISKKYDKLIYLIYTIILILLCTFVSAESNNYAFYMILTTIISTRLIQYSIIKNKKREKNNKIIDFLAKESYGIYLIQYPIIYFLQNISTNEIIKNTLIIILTIIMSIILSFLLNKRLKNKHLKRIKAICICVIIIIGSIILIAEKDYSNEMKELENILHENQKLSEEKNNEFLNSENEEKREPDEGINEEKDEKVEESSSDIENIEDKKNKIIEKVKQLPIVGVGDSVLLGVTDELQERFPNGYFDSKISRTIVGGKEVLQKLKNQGKLSDTLILVLANNGDYSDKKNRDLMDLVEDREIYWVNAVGADDPKFNERFKEFASNYPNIHIVEWDEAAKNHPEYLYADGVHIKGSGIKAYVDTIYNAICNNYWKKYEKENY